MPAPFLTSTAAPPPPQEVGLETSRLGAVEAVSLGEGGVKDSDIKLKL